MIALMKEIRELARVSMAYLHSYVKADPYRAPEMMVRPLHLVWEYANLGPHKSDLGEICRRIHESSLWPRFMDLMERVCSAASDPNWKSALEEALNPLPPLLPNNASPADEFYAQSIVEANEARTTGLRDTGLHLPPFWMLELSFKGHSSQENTWRGLVFSVIMSLFVNARDCPPVEGSECLHAELAAWVAVHESADRKSVV